jgi:hypothetical protein
VVEECLREQRAQGVELPTSIGLDQLAPRVLIAAACPEQGTERVGVQGGTYSSLAKGVACRGPGKAVAGQTFASWGSFPFLSKARPPALAASLCGEAERIVTMHPFEERDNGSRNPGRDS